LYKIELVAWLFNYLPAYLIAKTTMENIDITTELTPAHLRIADLSVRASAAERRVSDMVDKLRALFVDYTIGYSKVKYLDAKYIPAERHPGSIFPRWSYDSTIPSALRVTTNRDCVLDFTNLKKYIDEIIATKPVDPWDEIYSVVKTGTTFDSEMENAYRTRVHELTEKLAAATAEMNTLRTKHSREFCNLQTEKKEMKRKLIAKHEDAIKLAATEHAKKLAAMEIDHKKFVTALYLKLKPDYSAYTSKIIQLNEEILAANAIIAEKTAENLKISELNQQLEQSRAQTIELRDQVNKLTSGKKELANKLVENTKLTNELINKLAAANEDVVYLNEKLTATAATIGSCCCDCCLSK
jgi:hypothetical protein